MRNPHLLLSLLLAACGGDKRIMRTLSCLARRLRIATRFLSTACAGAAVLLATGCAGDGPTEPGRLALQVAEGGVMSLQAGKTGTVAITVVRGGSFSGPVTLSVEGIPQGVTATLSPTTLESGASSATLTIVAAPNLPDSSLSLTVRGRGAGVTEATAAVSLTVTAPDPTLQVQLAPVQAVVTGTRSSKDEVGSVTCTVGWTATTTGKDYGTWDQLRWRLESSVGTPVSKSESITTSGGGAMTFAEGSQRFSGTWYWSWTQGGVPQYKGWKVTLDMTYTERSTGRTREAAPITISCDPGAAGEFSLAVSPASLSVAQGGSVSLTVAATRSGGFADAIALSLEGLPSGVTAPTAMIAAGADSAMLRLTAAQAAALGNSTLTVRAKAAGLADRTAQVPLSVTAAVKDGSSTQVTLGADVSAAARQHIRQIHSLIDTAPLGSSMTVRRPRGMTPFFAMNASGDPLLLNETADTGRVMLDATTTAQSLARLTLRTVGVGSEAAPRVAAHPRFAELVGAIRRLSEAGQTYIDASSVTNPLSAIVRDVATASRAAPSPARTVVRAVVPTTGMIPSFQRLGKVVVGKSGPVEGASFTNHGHILFALVAHDLATGRALPDTLTLERREATWWGLSTGPAKVGTLPIPDGRFRVTVQQTPRTVRRHVAMVARDVVDAIFMAAGAADLFSPTDDLVAEMVKAGMSDKAFDHMERGEIKEVSQLAFSGVFSWSTANIDKMLQKISIYHSVHSKFALKAALRQSFQAVKIWDGTAFVLERHRFYTDLVLYGGMAEQITVCRERSVFKACGSLWPLQTGNRWEYDGTHYRNGIPDFKSRRVQEVLAPAVTGASAFPVRTTRYVEGLNNTVQTQTVENRGDGVYLDGNLTYLHPSRVNTPAPSGFMLTGTKTLSVPAGQLECSLYVREASGVRIEECWRPEIGMIHRRQYANGTIVSMYELKNYSLKP
jgi:hypothetical protein